VFSHSLGQNPPPSPALGCLLSPGANMVRGRVSNTIPQAFDLLEPSPGVSIGRCRSSAASAGLLARLRGYCGMGVRTRGLDIAINAKRQIADAAARAEAKGVVERWNEQVACSRDMLWSPTIRAALIAGTSWLDVFCPGCGTSRAIDLRKVDRHPLASVATLVLGLRCSWCRVGVPTLMSRRESRLLRAFPETLTGIQWR
jgi:hypothetical protein